MRILSPLSRLSILYCSFRTVTCLALPQITQFSSVFAFGDSYTDNGSLSNFYRQNLSKIEESSLYPSTAGSLKRSADGLLWVEYLASYYKNAKLYDFARSGSTANNELLFRSTEDMNSQVEAYLKSGASSNSKDNAIFFLWTGVNDMNDLFKLHETDTPERKETLHGVFQTIKQNLFKLYDNGAQYIILMGLIPLETLPKYNNVSEKTRENLKQLVAEYNDGLQDIMNQFDTEKTGENAIFYDTNALFKNLYSKKEIQTNSVSHCEGGKHCQDFIWWDYLHPSTKTHEKIAMAIYQTIKELGW